MPITRSQTIGSNFSQCSTNENERPQSLYSANIKSISSPYTSPLSLNEKRKISKAVCVLMYYKFQDAFIVAHLIIRRSPNRNRDRERTVLIVLMQRLKCVGHRATIFLLLTYVKLEMFHYQRYHYGLLQRPRHYQSNHVSRYYWQIINPQ